MGARQVALAPFRGATGPAGVVEWAGLARLRNGEAEPLVVTFLGSNLGNTTPEECAALLGEIAETLRPGDCFLVSVDLQKLGSGVGSLP